MPPAAAAAALIPLAAGALPGIAAAATGAGKSKARAGNFKESTAYDGNRYEFGGRAGAADEMAQMERNRGEGFNSAAHGLLAEGYEDREMSNQARGLSLEARGRQAEAQNLMINRARGRNLISTGVADRARTDLGSRLSSMSASARGPAGLANAQTDAMAAQAQGLGQINSQEQTASMQEQLAAEQAAFGSASGMRDADTGLRAGDIGQRGQSLGAAGQMGQLGATYAGLENQTRNIQMQGNLAEQGNAAASHTAKDQINTGVDVHNADRDMDYIKMAAGGMAGGAQAGMQMPGAPAPAPGGGGGVPPPKVSDPLAKTGILGLGAPSAGSGPAKASLDVLGSDGSLDVNSSLKAHSNVATQFNSDPTGGMSGGGLLGLSDPKAKTEVLPLSDMPGKRLQMGNDDRAFYASDAQDDGRPSLSGPSPRFSQHQGLSIQTAPAKARSREMTPDEMMRAANAMGSGMRSDHDARMSQGPAVSDPRAKEEAYRLGMEAGAAHATKSITGQEMQPWGSAPEESAPADYVAPAGPNPLPPPPPPPGQVSTPEFTRPSTISQQLHQGGRRSLGINTGSPSRKRETPPSDPRAKKLGGVHSNEVSDTLDQTPAVSYRYKDPSYEPEAQRPGEQQAGFLTTDLKKTPLGAAVVEKRPDGLDGYNEHRLNGLQHAEIRNLHERLRELEAMVAGGSHGRR